MGLQEVGQFISTVGIPAGFSFALLVMIWSVLKAIAPYGQDAYERHAALIDALERSLREQDRNAEAQLEQLERLTEHMENTTSLRKVAVQAVGILERVAQRLEINVTDELDSMRRQLKDKGGYHPPIA
jgi:alcohol dehydrogenase class IV